MRNKRDNFGMSNFCDTLFCILLHASVTIAITSGNSIPLVTCNCSERTTLFYGLENDVISSALRSYFAEVPPPMTIKPVASEVCSMGVDVLWSNDYKRSTNVAKINLLQ
jgi:hypothetical protein